MIEPMVVAAEGAHDVLHLAHEVHYGLQTMGEVGLVMLGFMAVVFVVYLILGEI